MPVASGFVVSAAADLNVDGKLDLVGVGGNRLLVLLGKSDGTFSEPNQLCRGRAAGAGRGRRFQRRRHTRSRRRGCRPRSFHRDRAGAGVSLLKGNGDGTFASAVHVSHQRLPMSATGPAHRRLRRGRLQRRWELGSGPAVRHRRLSIVFGQGDGTSRRRSVHPYRSIGRASSRRRISKGTAVSGSRSPSRALRLTWMFLGPSVHVGNGDGTFQTAGAYPGRPSTIQPGRQVATILRAISMAMAFSDVISGNELLLGRGDGTYLPAVDLNFGGCRCPLPLATSTMTASPDLVTDSYDFHTGTDTVTCCWATATVVSSCRELIPAAEQRFRLWRSPT